MNAVSVGISTLCARCPQRLAAISRLEPTRQKSLWPRVVPVLPGNVARYAAPQLGLFIVNDALAWVGRRIREADTLLRFVQIPVFDGHHASLRSRFHKSVQN